MVLRHILRSWVSSVAREKLREEVAEAAKGQQGAQPEIPRPDCDVGIVFALRIEAGSTERIVASYEGAPLETPHTYSNYVTAPTKLNPTYTEVEVIKYQEVIEYRDVTKERYVPQEVEVLKTRTVINYKRVSLLDYLISY